jgi:hypothetical protein
MDEQLERLLSDMAERDRLARSQAAADQAETDVTEPATRDMRAGWARMFMEELHAQCSEVLPVV